jgi:hypothetical protein
MIRYLEIEEGKIKQIWGINKAKDFKKNGTKQV